MKKYIKSLIIITVIVVSFGTYYITSAITFNNMPRIEIETVSGDESLVEDLILDGAYSVDELYEPFQIEDLTTTYFRDLNTIEMFSGYFNPTYKRLVDEHRSFMRGKYVDRSNFYEDDEHLVVANLQYP